MCLSPVWGDCLCSATKDAKYFFEADVKSETECKEAILSTALNRAKRGEVCADGEAALLFNWSCSEKKKIPRQEHSISCDELSGMINAQELLSSVLLVSRIDESKKLELKAPGAQERDCVNEADVGEKELVGDIKNVEGIEVVIHDRTELEETVKSLVQEKAIVGEALDLIENGGISFYIHNDNGVGNMIGSERRGDDIGDTHGFKLSFVKAIGEGGYRLRIEYESNLYTNFATPEKRGFWKDDDGNWHVAQYFIEENLGKVVFEKQAKGDAFFWSAGAGLQELNKSNPEGTLGFFSAMGSQVVWHKAVSDMAPGSARLYDNLGQEGDELAPFIEAEAGKRYTMSQTVNSRLFLEGKTGLRYTGVENASFGTASASANFDYQLTPTVATRASVGYEAKVYVDGSNAGASFIDIIVGGKEFQGGFKYEFKNGRAPAYQNALPSGFVDREVYAPRDDNLWTIYIKYKWK